MPEIIKDLLKNELPEIPDKPGLMNSIEHVIDVGGDPAIRERYCLVSTVVMEATIATTHIRFV